MGAFWRCSRRPTASRARSASGGSALLPSVWKSKSALHQASRRGDATNYLGGIADALEVKRHRIKTSGSLDHLGYRQEVGLYGNDSQIKEVRYREVESDRASYTVTLRDLDRPASG
jgi:hypothetical protein